MCAIDIRQGPDLKFFNLRLYVYKLPYTKGQIC